MISPRPAVAIRGAIRRARSVPTRAARFAVRRLGMPPAWGGYRFLDPVSIQAHLRRYGDVAGSYEVVHPEATARHPYPVNVERPEDLPDDRGWWGYSFRDVPTRRSGATVIATLEQCRVVPFVDPENDQFYVCVVTADDRVLDMREMAFRTDHPRILRSMTPTRVASATWVLERVYHNHSHWLTAHLPKILLAREKGLAGEMVLPGAKTNETIESSLRMLGLDGDRTPRLDRIEPLEVDRLTLIETDRFRPELLRSVRDEFSSWISGSRQRRIFISRAHASRRRLVNEDEVWLLARSAGFERVFMEELPFEEQIRIMGDADAVMAPHGAGLTNVIFCPEGTKVIEIADLGFPNPNFYALASAMGHRYFILSAESRGGGHPLERNMWIDPAHIRHTLREL